MRKLAIAAAVPAVLLAFSARAEQIHAALSGYEETPSVSTPASGSFRARITSDGQFIDYELSYGGLRGTVTQAHIHFAREHEIGSIMVWLCQTSTHAAPIGNPPSCPPSTQGGVSVSGTIRASDVVAASSPAQQITAGALGEVIAAIRAGAAYVNVHSTAAPGGEVRGQIRASRRR